MRSTSFLAGMLCCVGTSTTAWGQQSGSAYPAPIPSGSTYYFNSSTAREGELRGLAELGRAVGEQNYHSATANLIQEKARLAALENDYEAVKYWYQKKAFHREYTAARRPSYSSMMRFSQERAPKRPTKRQVDVAHGFIRWPTLLAQVEFDAPREELDALFFERRYEGDGLGGETHRQVQVAAEEMRAILRDMLREVEPSEYIVAKKFIDSLAYEARFPVGGDSLAVGDNRRPANPARRVN